MIQEKEIRYLLSFLTIFSLTLSIGKKDILNIPASILVLLVAYDYRHVMLFMVFVIVDLIFLIAAKKWYKKLSKKLSFGHIMMTINFVFLLAYKLMYKDFPLDISGPIMLLCIKFYYLGAEIENLCLKDTLIYTFLLPGILTGPVPSYKDFLVKKKTSVRQANKGMQAIIESLLYLFIHALLRPILTFEVILNEKSLSKRILFLIIHTIVTKAKYYFAWTFSYGCYLFAGYPGMKNVFPLHVEFASTIKDLNNSWNVFTNAWLKESIFIPLKSYGYYTASFFTFFISALWHGLHLNYFVMFLSFSLFVPLLNNNTRLFKKFFGNFEFLISILQLSLFTSYFCVPFFILKFNKMLGVWKSIFYYGHIFVAISILVFIISKVKKKNTKKLNNKVPIANN